MSGWEVGKNSSTSARTSERGGVCILAAGMEESISSTARILRVHPLYETEQKEGDGSFRAKLDVKGAKEDICEHEGDPEIV